MIAYAVLVLVLERAAFAYCYVVRTYANSIPEEDFDIATATITDVGFLGFFPKPIYQELRRHEREIEKADPAAGAEFQVLFNQLIAAFIYRPIMIQKVIHLLIAKYRQGIEKLAKRREAVNNSSSDSTTNQSHDHPSPEVVLPVRPAHQNPKRVCYATKCRL